MIKTEEFPKERWESYLSELTREAEDHLMSIRVDSLNLGDQILAKGVRLVALGLEQKGSEQGAIEIIGERPDKSHLTHLIANPQRIFLARYEEKQAVCLDIEDQNGTKTLVFIHEGGVS